MMNYTTSADDYTEEQLMDDIDSIGQDYRALLARCVGVLENLEKSVSIPEDVKKTGADVLAKIIDTTTSTELSF
jgi:hypothetical protein